MKRPAISPRPKQSTPQEVLESLLGLVQRKFYQGQAVEFAKDRKRLLQWAILWPARHFFNPKGVTVPAERYRELLTQIIMDAVVHGAEKVRYRPAWLMQVVQSHFAIHGEQIYTEAKSARALAENTLLAVGKLPVRNDGLVDQFTAASRLLDTTKKRLVKSPSKPVSQPDLFAS